MNAFNRRTAIRMAIISILLAAIASPIAWLVTRERTEEATVSLAIEESKRLLQHFNATELVGPEASEPAMQSLIAGSFLHDVGKIGIPDAILLKPGKLDEREFEIMRTHVSLGEEIVTGMGWLDGANAVVAGHHEKWNGKGYPRQLQGKEIPLSARIFAVADVFDALCSWRPYKAPMSFETAMGILEQDTGSHFDPQVMAVFRPMAGEVHRTLVDASEEQVRDLLERRVRRHFAA